MKNVYFILNFIALLYAFTSNRCDAQVRQSTEIEFNFNNCCPNPPYTVEIKDGFEPPSFPLNPYDYGQTFPEAIDIEIEVCLEDNYWSPIIVNVSGHYSVQIQLIDGVEQVTGPNGNTAEVNFCDQVFGLGALGMVGNWYMIEAVEAHENLHVSRLLPALQPSIALYEDAIEGIRIEDVGQDETEIIQAFQNDVIFDFQKQLMLFEWLNTVLKLTEDDHNGPTDEAEREIIIPMIESICCYALDELWPECQHCLDSNIDCN